MIAGDALGDAVVKVPHWQCSYGVSIRLGDHAFVDAKASFMDDAAITVEAHA